MLLRADFAGTGRFGMFVVLDVLVVFFMFVMVQLHQAARPLALR
jgi:hypothetical protein